MKKINIFLLILLSLFGASCNDDFLNRSPLDAINQNSFFKNASDLKSYMTGLYGTVLRGDQRWNGLANGTDDFVYNSPSPSLMMRNSTGIPPQTSTLWNNTYTNIRSINYYIQNARRVAEQTAAANHYKGEGYYFRAYYYFTLVQAFGDVPLILEPLNQDSEDLYRPRDSRAEVMKQVIADLDSAIFYLQPKGVGEASQGRLNKQSALVMKTTAGLFEGSWEYYHGQRGTPFKVDGANPNVFLQAVVDAGDMLIAQEGAKIYTSTNEPYLNLFYQNTYASIPGAFFYREYNRSLSKTHDWNGSGVGGWGDLTQAAVIQYLMKDGKPQEISSLKADYNTLNGTIDNKDPRLNQTIWKPSRGTFFDYFGGAAYEGIHNYHVNMPGFKITQQRNPSNAGYRIIKGIPLAVSEWRNGESDDLIIRYEEALLNYAEAKAILGTISQADLDKTVNLLRDRVQMPHMTLADVNSWSITYSAKDGYDPSASNIVNEIRRERRVELMLEGFREGDLRRWAIKDLVFNNTKPKGVMAQEFITFWNSRDSLEKYGFVYSKPEEVTLKIGVDIDVFEDGSINPFWKLSDFNANGQGYYIDPNRDYLNGIPSQEIEIYKTKGNVTLTQNPGWVN